jgi:hypothetical protein
MRDRGGLVAVGGAAVEPRQRNLVAAIAARQIGGFSRAKSE